MTEHDMSRKLVKKLREVLGPEGFVIFKHNDRVTAGIPDISVTGNGMTTWWEVKNLTGGRTMPKERGRGLQAKNMSSLYAAGHCYYIIFSDDETSIEPGNLTYRGKAWVGRNVDLVVDHIWQYHRDKEI